MNREDHWSINQAVEFQLLQKKLQNDRYNADLIKKLNRAVSTPPPTERDLALQRYVEKRERKGTIHSSEYGD